MGGAGRGGRRFREVCNVPKATQLEINEAGVRVQMHLNPGRDCQPYPILPPNEMYK